MPALIERVASARRRSALTLAEVNARALTYVALDALWRAAFAADDRAMRDIYASELDRRDGIAPEVRQWDRPLA